MTLFESLTASQARYLGSKYATLIERGKRER